MKTSEHPQLEDLLLWQTGELSSADAEVVESHLKECSECQHTLANAETMFGRIARVDAEAERRRKRALSKRRWNRSGKVFKSRTFMGTTASVVIGGLLLVTFTQWTPEASAESLLTKAVQEQARETRSIHFLKVQSGPLACNVTLGQDSAQLRLASIGAPSFCDSISGKLNAVGRTWSNLLSAESFQQWRHALVKRQDSIYKSDDMIQVSTTTDDGLLRKATLRLQSSNYRPVAAHFEFAGSEPLKIDVNETNRPEEIVSHPSVSTTTPQQVIDPMDEIEAQVRLAFHQAQLDRNILLAVERKHDAVKVWGDVPAAADRDAVNQAVQNIPHVQLSVLTEAEQQEQQKPLPWTSFQGDGPPLAYDQLKVLYPDGGSTRQEFQNDLDSLTLHLVGEARTRDALLALRSRLSTTAYNQPLENAAAELADSMRREALALAAQLAPLTGPVSHGGGALNYRQAMQLYTLVHEMTFAGNQQDNLQLSQAVAQTRRLLSRR